MPPEFTLQPVLDYRHTRVEILEIELSQVLQAQRRGETFLQALQSSQGRLFDQLRQSQQGDVDLFLLARLRASLKTVNERISEQQARLVELAAEAQAKREAVIAARQDEEALNKLKEREIERYRADQQQAENRQQDDLYISRAYRRSASTA